MKSALIFVASLFAAMPGSAIAIPDGGAPESGVSTPSQPTLHALWKDGVAIFGEIVSITLQITWKPFLLILIFKAMPGCTRCVGHHGLCRIGDGSCYAPDGCYFCGGCNAERARCQDPNKESCQCY